jgi:hypothetical protein
MGKKAYKIGPAVLEFLVARVGEEVAAGAEGEGLEVVGVDGEGRRRSLENLDRSLDGIAVFGDGWEDASKVVAGAAA